MTLKTIVKAGGVTAALLLSGVLVTSLPAQIPPVPPVADVPLAPLAITGNPSSARHCVSGDAANVHAIGFMESGTRYTISFETDGELATSVMRLDFVGRTTLGGVGTPDMQSVASSPGTAVLYVGAVRGSACYRYKVDIQRPAVAVAADAQAHETAQPLMTAAAQTPFLPNAITGLASSAKHCLTSTAAHVHVIGRVEQGTTMRVTFDPTSNFIAGATLRDMATQRGVFWIDNGDADLHMLASQAGTLALFVASRNGQAGCYRYKVEITPSSSPTPSPVPAPSPSPAPAPSPSPAPAPGGTRTFDAVWVNAAWITGITGTPVSSRGIEPPTWFGTLCPANSLVFENRPTQYPAISNQALVARNNCSTAVFIAFCQSAGTGGGGGDIPVCATDPRQTPEGSLKFLRVSRTVAQPTGIMANQSPINLDLNVFWCSDASSFNLGRVNGIASLACVEN